MFTNLSRKKDSLFKFHRSNFIQADFCFCLTFFCCYFCVFCSISILNWYCFVLLPVFLAGIQPTSANSLETTTKTVPKYLFIHILLVIVDSFIRIIVLFLIFLCVCICRVRNSKDFIWFGAFVYCSRHHTHKICYVKLCKYLLRFLFTMTVQAMELKNSFSARSALKTIREC